MTLEQLEHKVDDLCAYIKTGPQDGNKSLWKIISNPVFIVVIAALISYYTSTVRLNTQQVTREEFMVVKQTQLQMVEQIVTMKEKQVTSGELVTKALEKMDRIDQRLAKIEGLLEQSIRK